MISIVVFNITLIRFESGRNANVSMSFEYHYSLGFWLPGSSLVNHVVLMVHFQYNRNRQKIPFALYFKPQFPTARHFHSRIRFSGERFGSTTPEKA